MRADGAARLLGRDARDSEGIWTAIYQMAASLGHTRGPMMEALAGVDMALWDWRGKAENQSIAALLAGESGGQARAHIPCYASPVRFCETSKQSAELARKFVTQGFRALKVKAGRGLQTDLAHLQAIRAQVGPHVALMVDFNCAYDAGQTLAFAREAQDLNLAWLEEPLPTDQIEAMAQLRERIKIPLAGGENEFAPAAFKDLLERGALDILQPTFRAPEASLEC